MINKLNSSKFIDYFFWALFIIFTNPGGIFIALGEDTSKVGIDVSDYIFVLIFGCYLFISRGTKIQDKTYNRFIKYLVFFCLYYFIMYGYMVPSFKDASGYSTFLFLKKSRKTVYNLLLFAIVYRFYLRSYIIFYKTFIISSILILSLFFIGFFSGIEILPIVKMNRGFVNIDRIFLTSYGLMFLLVPSGILIIVFKSKFKWKKYFLIAFLMILISIVLTITRREILGVFIYLFIALILHNFFRHKSIIPFKKIFSSLILFVVFAVLINLSFPKYTEASVVAVEESIYVIKHGETLSGKKDVRLGLGKTFMQNLIFNNIYFGTGFDDRWRTQEGGRKGYETSDYPFLSAIAMMGVVGVLIFLPVYVLLFKTLIFDIKFLRKNKVNYSSFIFFIFILFILYFSYNLMQYMNLFYPVSMSRKFEWYVYLSMYLASRQIFYDEFNKKHLQESV